MKNTLFNDPYRIILTKRSILFITVNPNKKLDLYCQSIKYLDQQLNGNFVPIIEENKFYLFLTSLKYFPKVTEVSRCKSYLVETMTLAKGNQCVIRIVKFS